METSPSVLFSKRKSLRSFDSGKIVASGFVSFFVCLVGVFFLVHKHLAEKVLAQDSANI